MRLCLTFGLALLCGACTPPSTNMFGGNETTNSGRSAVATPAIAIAATGPGGCAATWDGTPVSADQIAERSFALLQRVVDAAGGVRNVTEDMLPIPNVEAPAALGFACADPILFALQRSGMTAVRLRPTGGQAPVLADFPIEMNAPPQPIPTVLGIGAGGQVTWNGEPVDAARLGVELTRIGGSPAEPDPMEGAPPPGGPELRVAREATFGQLYDLLRTTQRYHLRPAVHLPSAQAGPPATTAPPPPPGDPLANRR